MANSFLNSIGRISSSTCRDEVQDIAYEPDIPLDAFDKHLLAECPQEIFQPAEYGDSSEYSQARLSLPPKAMDAPTGRVDPARMLREEIYRTPTRNHGLSSSSAAAASSPTIAARQTRQLFHSSGPSTIRSSRTGRDGRYTEHAGAIVTAEPQRFPHSAQGRSEPYQQSQGATTSKLQGGTTRMGQGHAPPIVQGIPLTAATELPDRYRSIFRFPLFNAVQSKCFNIAFGSDDNLVVSAPTGSGKTAIMELAICQLMHMRAAGDFKVVYQAPTKSLCSERMRDWSGKFASLDLPCAELTGDTEHNQLKNVQGASIIITTPEKWDSVTRKWKDNARLMKMVRLFLIDEVHMLKETRGATLEAVVSRMKSVGSDVRFLALSATVPNSDDIATWLGKAPDAQHLPAHREVFGENVRPVKLQKHVWCIRGPPNDFAFDKALNTSLQDAIAKYSRKKPTMIFCTTRKMAVDTAKMLADLFMASQMSCQLWPAPKKTYRMVDAELSKTIPAGVAFHHGGVDAADRRAIEEGFLSSDISIICCTSTLAVGVNLPCYLVVIKGTVTWTDKGSQEYSDLEIMQMLGRAGRPQFETSACAVILTRPEKEQHYKKMVSGEEILESCLHLNLIDHLNSEIGLGTVSDITSAKKWLASTFMFVRLQKNPRHYQLEGEVEHYEHDELLERICAKDISLLQEARLVCDASRLKCTEFGDAMARYCIKFDTMKTILMMPPKAKISEIISTLAQASEFSDVRIKSGEKGLYKELNGDVGIKFPIKVDIAQNPHKVSLLIQSELGGSIFPNHDKWKKHKTQFNIDKNMVFSHVNRLIRCVIDCQLHLEDAVSVRHCLELARSLAARVWDNSPYQMKQIEAIGDVGVRKLAQAGIKSIETLQNTEPHRIEQILSRLPPFGQKVLAKAVEFPSLRISAKEMGKERRPGHWVKIKFKADVGFINEKLPMIFRKKMVYVCFLAETSDGKLIDFRRFAAKKLENGQEIFLSVQLTMPTTSINCHIMCDEIAGTSQRAELQLENFPASYFSAQQLIAAEPGEPAPVVKTTRKDSEDFDELGEIDDADLLAAFDNEGDIEVIHDIDDIVLDSKKPSKTSLKRTADKISTEQKVELKAYKEPIQLENGNWTCQHTCKEDGKTCKHKCCADGVERPVKPSRKKLVKKDTFAKDSAKDMIETKSQNSSPFDKARSQAEAKKQKLIVPSTREVNSTRRRHEAKGSKEEQTSLALSQMPTHRYEKGTTPQLSFMQNPYGLSKSTTESVETSGDVEEEHITNLGERLRKQHEESPAFHGSDVFDFDMDDDLDNLDINEMTSLAVSSEVSNPASSSNEMPINPKPWNDKGSTAICTQDGDDFACEESVRAEDWRLMQTMSTGVADIGCRSPIAEYVGSMGKVRKSLSIGLGNEVDFGAFNAPLTHLAPAVTQRWALTSSATPSHQVPALGPQDKGLFITGESSSPEKTLLNPPAVFDEVEDYTNPAVEAFFATLAATDYDVGDPPAKKQKLDQYQDQDSGLLILSPKALPELHASSTSAFSSPKDHELPRQPLTTLHNSLNRQQPAQKQDMLQPCDRMLTAEEEEKRLADEEQRKKWVGLEDFYEQFGEYVEIVD